LDLALVDPTNAQIAEQVGPSVVTLDSTVGGGVYTYAVSGGRCSFTLTVTVTG
jgi:hypothetical protein